MTQKRTSIWHCLWGLPFLLTGGAVFGYTIFHGLMHITDALTQVVVPGKAELSLQHGQRYTVFLEEQSVVNGKVFSSNESIVGLECHVKSLQRDITIALEKSSMSTSYSVNGRSGHAVLEFPVAEDGRYEFACDYGNAQKGADVVLAIGAGVGDDIFRMVAESLLAAFGGFGACLLVVLVVLFKREREKKKAVELGQSQIDPRPRGPGMSA